MSTLTLSILALIGVVVGLVVVYNLWQGHSARKARELNRRLTKGHFDPAPADAPLAPRRAREEASRPSRWKAAVAEVESPPRDRREPTLDGEEAAAVVAGIARVAMDRQSGRDDRQVADEGVADAGFMADEQAHRPLHAAADGDDTWQEQDAAHAAATHRGIDQDRRSDRFIARYDDRGGHHVDEDADVDPVSVGGPRVGHASAAATRDAVTAEARSLREGGSAHAGHPGQAGDGSAGGRPATASSFPAKAVRPAQAPAPAFAVAAAGGGSAVDVAEVTSPAGLGAAPDHSDEEVAADEAAEAGSMPQEHEADVEHSVVLRPVSAINAERLIALTSSFRHIGGKAVRIQVDQGQGTWTPLKSGGKVRALRLSIVLANRQGPLNPVELSDFTATIESLAAQLQAPYQSTDIGPVLRDARELDTLAARLDTQLDLTVECPEPISPRGLSTLARQLDLHDRGGGRFAAFADDGDPLFIMMAGESPDQVVFVLDVPRTARRHQAWRAMVTTASGCSQAVKGRLVDMTGRGLSIGMIEGIERQLDDRYRELARVGLPAGSPAALRVFG